MKIFVAIDGSKNSLRGLKVAGKLSEPSHLILANAHDDMALRGASQFVGKQAVDRYLDDLAETELRSATEQARKSGVTFESRMLRGRVAQTIAESADDSKCDLIVLGSKGRSALKDLMIGSVSQRVSSLAKTPVLLVK